MHFGHRITFGAIICISQSIQLIVGVVLTALGAKKIADGSDCVLANLPWVLMFTGISAIIAMCPIFIFLLAGALLFASHVVFTNYTYQYTSANYLTKVSQAPNIEKGDIVGNPFLGECDRQLLSAGVVGLIILWDTVAISIFYMLLSTSKFEDRIGEYQRKLSYCFGGKPSLRISERNKPNVIPRTPRPLQMLRKHRVHGDTKVYEIPVSNRELVVEDTKADTSLHVTNVKDAKLVMNTQTPEDTLKKNVVKPSPAVDIRERALKKSSSESSSSAVTIEMRTEEGDRQTLQNKALIVPEPNFTTAQNRVGHHNTRPHVAPLVLHEPRPRRVCARHQHFIVNK